MRRSISLDILRTALAFFVLFSHLIPWSDSPAVLKKLVSLMVWIFQPSGETNPAVLAFIVLSGYCIHKSGLKCLRDYAIRRAFRILPVFMGASLVGVALFTFSSRIDSGTAARLSGTDHISGWLMILKLSGLSAFIPTLNTTTYQGNAPLHTVMVECWLYVAYPLLLIGVVKKYSQQALWLFLGGLWIEGILLCRGTPMENWWHNGSFFGFLIYWWVGAWFVDNRPSGKFVLTALAGFLLCSLPLMMGFGDLLIVESRKLLFAVLIGYGVLKLDNGGHSDKFWPLQAGYSLYAFHAPIIYTAIILGFPWWYCAVLAIVAGAFSYLIFEKPLTHFGKKLA